MTKADKRTGKIRKNVKNVPLAESESLINEYGHIEHEGKHPKAIVGSHTMPYKRENPAKSCYVKELIAIIDSI